MGQSVVGARSRGSEVVQQWTEFCSQFLHVPQAGRDRGTRVGEQAVQIVQGIGCLRPHLGYQVFEIVQRTADVRPVAVVEQIVSSCERDLQAVEVLIQLLD